MFPRLHSKYISKKRFQFEQLEPRVMMAVFASITPADDLVVTGGRSGPENIAITGDLEGRITITGVSDAQGNPTYVNNIPNGSVTYGPISGQLVVRNNESFNSFEPLVFTDDSHLTIDNVYLTNGIGIAWGGVNTIIELGKNQPVYSEFGISVAAIGPGINRILAKNATVYSYSDVTLQVYGVDGLIDSSTVQSNTSTRFLGQPFNSTRRYEPQESFTATITNAWAGQDIVVTDYASSSNVYITYSSSLRDITLFNSNATQTYWITAFIYATNKLSVTADAQTIMNSNTIGVGSGTTNIALAFCGASQMEIKSNGALGAVDLFSNNIFGENGLTLVAGDEEGVDNTFTLRYNVIEHDLTTDFGLGDETLDLVGNQVKGAAILDGASGTNRLRRQNNVFNSINVSNFVDY